LHITTIFTERFLTTTSSDSPEITLNARTAGILRVASILPLIFFALKAHSIVALLFTDHYILLYFTNKKPIYRANNNHTARRAGAGKAGKSNSDSKIKAIHRL
jgi:hypothetical protein